MTSRLTFKLLAWAKWVVVPAAEIRRHQTRRPGLGQKDDDVI